MSLTLFDLFAIIAAPFFGSFITAAANAWPDWSAVGLKRSKCDGCTRVLGPLELIPILSFALQGGKCAKCKAPIWPGHPIGETACLIIALLAVWAGDGPVETGLAIVLGWALVFAALVDWRTFLLPDIITLPLIPLGLAAAFLREGQGAALAAAIGAVIGYAAFAGLGWLYRRLRGRDGLGLGDAKLLAAGGAWAGPLLLTWIVALGAGLTLAGLLIARLAGGERMRADTAAPFGPGLAAAAFLIHIAALAGIGPGSLLL